MPNLGRKPYRPDERDWPVERLKARIAAGVSVPLDWSVPSILDQGDTGHCVGFGTCGACNSDDEHHVASGLTDSDAHALYYAAKVIEGDPGGEDGAYVRDGLKAAKQAGYIDAYSLLRGAAQITDWLENHGPVVVGTDWFSGMDSPAADGKVRPTGTIRGGHCYYAHGDLGGNLDFVNSWGTSWADGGHFYVAPADFTRLMNGDFEAWAVTQAAPAPPEPTPTPTPTPDKPASWFVAFIGALVEFLTGWLKDNG